MALLSIQSQARGNSHRDVDDLLAERGIDVSHESIRLWSIKFGTIYTRRLKRKHRGHGDTFFIDEFFAGVPDQNINGKQHYLRCAVDQNGEVVDVFLQTKRDGAAAKRLRVRGLVMRRFKSVGQAQRFVGAHVAVSNLFNLGRHLVRAEHYPSLRRSAFSEWSRAVV